MDSLIVPPVE